MFVDSSTSHTTHLGSCDDVVEVILVHEVVPGMSPAHDQRHARLVVLAGALPEEVAVEGGRGVGDRVPVVVPDIVNKLTFITNGCLHNCLVSSPAAVRGLAVVPARGQVGGEELHVQEVVLDIR